MSMKSVPLWVLLLNAVAVSLAVIIYQLGGRDHFGERGFITFLSTGQLFTIAWLAYGIFKAKKILLRTGEKSRLAVWLIITLGFIFLAADEFLSLHEVADLFIHDVFNIQETNLSDRLDDAIVALYGVLSVGLLWFYRNEFTAYKAAVALFKKGFLLLFLMICLDLFANEQDLLEIVFTPETSNTIQIYLNQLEDSLKVFAEAFFILAFHSIFQVTRFKQKKWYIAREQSSVK